MTDTLKSALVAIAGTIIGCAVFAAAVAIDESRPLTPAPVCAKAWAEQMGYTPIHVHCVDRMCSVRVAEPPWLVHLKCNGWSECVARVEP